MRFRFPRARYMAALALVGAGSTLCVGAIVDEAPISAIHGAATNLAAPHGVGVDSSGVIYVANQASGVMAFAPNAVGNAAPIAEISDPPGTGTPLGIFVNSDDHVWVAYNSGHVAEYGPHPSTGAVPLRVLDVSEAGAINSIRGVVVDAEGRIYTADCDSGIIKVFAPDASGTPTPLRVIQGSNTLLGPQGAGQSWGLDLDADGNILVADGTRVLKFAAAANGNVAPIATINPASHPFFYAIEVEAVASGDIYVVDRSRHAVYIFPSSALDSGADTDTPLQVIEGPATLMTDPVGLSVLPDGTILVGDNGGSDAIRRYAAFGPGGRPGGAPGGGGSGDSGSGGASGSPLSGGAGTGAVSPASPAERPRSGVSIDCGSRFTNTQDVTLCIQPPEGASRMVISNDGGFAGATAVPVAARSAWRLDTSGPTRLPKTVYVRFEGPGVNREITYTDDIILDETRPEVVSALLVPAAGQTARARRAPRYVLKVRARDSQSPVGRMVVAIGRRTLAPTKFVGQTVLATRSTQVRVRVRDRAGNWSRWQPAWLG